MSGVALSDARLIVPMPAGWERMPGPTDPSAADWVTALSAGLEEGAADRLRAGLRAALATAASQEEPRRLRWVFLGDPPVASVQAWAFLDLVPRSEPDGAVAADAFAEALRTAAAPETSVRTWHRDVLRRDVADGPAVVVHDLLTVADGTGTVAPVVQHRVLVVLFPEAQVVASFTVSTPRLTAFPDIEQSATAIADGIRFESA